MKTISMIMFFLVFFFSLGTAGGLRADGCYLCKGGGYVRYAGSDTFNKRKKAEKIGCRVTGTTGSCSQSKGMVK